MGREVLDYVTPQLGKHERRQYEEAKIRALGGEKTLGVSTSVSSHRKQWAVDRKIKIKKEALKEKKRRREDGLLRIGLGAKESRGMAVISNRALKGLQRGA